jgi:hypothetical protein
MRQAGSPTASENGGSSPLSLAYLGGHLAMERSWNGGCYPSAECFTKLEKLALDNQALNLY